MKSVPFFEYPRAYLDDKEMIISTIDEVCSRGAFIMQKELESFERNLAKYSGAEYAIGVANGTDAMELAWSAIGLKPGDEVIISAHTMLATASAIKLAGGVPVPVDIGDDWMMDHEACETAITSRTVAIAPTQLNGRTCNMEVILRVANDHNLMVFEDAAQALGSRFDGQMAGTFGFAGSYSFYPAKVLGSLGDGGALITNDESIYDRVYQLHDHGRDQNGEVQCWGRNSRLDNVQAALLDKRLADYEAVIERRRHLAGIYQDRLCNLDMIKLPPGPSNAGPHFDVYQNYEICAARRDELRRFLSENGVGTIIQWGGQAIHQFPKLGVDANLPKVEEFFEKCLLLPMNTFLTDDDVHYVCDCIGRFYGISE